MVLKRLVQELRAKNATLETDQRLLLTKIKTKKNERAGVDDPKTHAKKIGTIYLFFFFMPWERRALFGPCPPDSFDPFAASVDIRQLALYRLYALTPEDYHQSINSYKTGFAEEVCTFNRLRLLPAHPIPVY